MRASIDSEKVVFRNNLMDFEVVLVTFLQPSALQDSEDCNIEALVNMGPMSRITEDNNLVGSCIFEEALGIM